MQMRIKVGDLEKGKKDFDYLCQPQEMDFAEEGVGLAEPLKVSGSAWLKRSQEVIVQATLNGRLEAPCDRCLRAVPLPVDLSFEAHLISAALDRANKNTELQSEDLDFSVFDDNGEIDVDELAREQLLLILPVQLLCGADCRGLCPQCGADLNAGECAGCATATHDSRWDALGALKGQS